MCIRDSAHGNRNPYGNCNCDADAETYTCSTACPYTTTTTVAFLDEKKITARLANPTYEKTS